MMKIFLVPLFFLVVSISTFSQSFELYKGDTINITDKSEMKQGHWMLWCKYPVCRDFKEGQLMEEGNYINDKKEGVWTVYYYNQKMKFEFMYANSLQQGNMKIFYKNGVIQEEGVWNKNHWVGPYRYYYEDGRLFYDFLYNSEGKREGIQKQYFPNGYPMFEGYWQNGRENGILKEFYDNGSIRAEKHLINGEIDLSKTKNYDLGNPIELSKSPIGYIQPEPKVNNPTELPKDLTTIPDGEFTTYFKGDKFKIEMEGIFKNKKLIDGKHNIYDAFGKLIKINTIKGGKIVGSKIPK